MFEKIREEIREEHKKWIIACGGNAILGTIMTIIVGLALIMVGNVLIGRFYTSMPTAGIPSALNDSINATITSSADAFSMTMLVFIVLPMSLVIGVLIGAFAIRGRGGGGF